MVVAIAVSVLLMACINFVNLAVGRGAARAGEIGVRKSVGATRQQLLQQFLGEAAVLVMLGMVCGVAIAEAALPTFNALFAYDMDLSLLTPTTIAVLLLLAVTVSVGAGAYPAVVLSGLRPLTAIQKRVSISGPATFTRVLVGIQLALSVGLISTTVIIRDQLHHVMTRDLGLDEERVVVVDSDGLKEMNPKHPLMMESFARHHLVAHVSSARYDFMLDPPRGIHNAITADGGEVETNQYFVDHAFVKTMGLELVAGRNFSAERDNATAAAIVSETLAKRMGWEDAIGQQFAFDERGSRMLRHLGQSATVIGVVKDFTFRSGYENPPPGVLLLNPSLGRSLYEAKLILVRLSPGDMEEALGFLADTWAEIEPGVDFRYSFLQQDLEQYYADEIRWQRLVTWAAACAVVIAALGAFALTALAAGRRTKEIGIRKVLGATVASVAALLTREFALLAVAGALVSGPVAWWVTKGWLENFSYRIEVGPWHFMAGGLLTLGVVVGSAGYQALKAALARPVEALRYE